MTDTPQHIKDLQLQIWLTKTPAKRLRQFMTENDAFLKFCGAVQSSNAQISGPSQVQEASSEAE